MPESWLQKISSVQLHEYVKVPEEPNETPPTVMSIEVAPQDVPHQDAVICVTVTVESSWSVYEKLSDPVVYWYPIPYVLWHKQDELLEWVLNVVVEV